MNHDLQKMIIFIFHGCIFIFAWYIRDIMLLDRVLSLLQNMSDATASTHFAERGFMY